MDVLRLLQVNIENDENAYMPIAGLYVNICI